MICVQLNHDDIWNLIDMCVLRLTSNCITCGVGIVVSGTSWDPGSSGETTNSIEITLTA